MAKKKHGVKWWKKKAWEACSKYIRLKDAIKTTGTKETLICYTCGKPYLAFGTGCAQAGHFIPGRGNSILFETEGIHSQCYNCNVRLSGNWPEYLKHMIKDYGQEYVDELLKKRYEIRKFTPSELEEIRNGFKKLYKTLEKEFDIDQK